MLANEYLKFKKIKPLFKELIKLQFVKKYLKQMVVKIDRQFKIIS